MTAMIQGDQQRALVYGTAVFRPTSTVPQTATASIFTVAGGRVVVTSLIGIVTTAGSATDPVLKLAVTPTVGSARDLCAVVATFTTSAIGTHLIVGNFASATAMVASVGFGTMPTLQAVVPAGVIQAVAGASNATLAVQWTLTYVALDNGASVVAA